MAKLTYRNESGDTLTFGDKAPFLITKIEGLGSPKNEIHKSKSPYQDGTTITHATLEERELVLEGVILYAKREERQRYRDRLIKVFNPKLKGELIFERDGTKKKIECVVEQAPYFPSNMQEPYQMFSLIFICPNPFWLDDIEISEEITTWIGGISFPLRLPTTFAMAGPRIINIINNGDVETPVKIEILGPATNPKITLRETGEVIRIKKELTSDDVVTITTEFGNKRVELNGQNAFNILDLPYSTFFNLKVGDNVIEFTTEDVSNNANAKISYRNRYLGI